MKVRIHRGTQEIGGTCIELDYAGERPVLDVGRPLDSDPKDEVPLPDVPGLASGDDPNLLGPLPRLARRAHLENDRAQLREAQRLFESDSVAQELLDNKVRLLEKEASLRLDAERVGHAIQATERELSIKHAQVTRLEKQYITNAEALKELDAADRLRRAAEMFVRELSLNRTSALAEQTTLMTKQLAHKSHLIDRIEISSADFSIRMIDQQDREVRNLSAGEREIFALSLVWALGQIAHKSLPMMIDTPLGRLDQSHRANVITRFLPLAAKQVIVLATDSEIDRRWYRILEPHIAQELTIQYMPNSQTSCLQKDSYFSLTQKDRAAK